MSLAAMSWSHDVLADALSRLNNRDPMEHMVPESRITLAWTLGDIELAESIAASYSPKTDAARDNLKDLMTRVRTPHSSASDMEIYEAYVTSRCTDPFRHPDIDWDSFIPECDGPDV